MAEVFAPVRCVTMLIYVGIALDDLDRPLPDALPEIHSYEGSEDEVLRDALRALSEEVEDLAALQQAINEWRAGDEGVPVVDAFHALRKKHGLS